MFNDPSGRGLMALFDLQSRIADELRPEYLLIDARTGVTELGSLATTVLADVERDLIRTRTAEGRSRAKARGQHMGRPPSLTQTQKAEARQRRAEGATLKELARSYNVGVATISRLAG